MIHALRAACSSVLRTRVPRHQAWIFIACSSLFVTTFGGGFGFSTGGGGYKEKQGTLRKCYQPTSALAYARKGSWYFVHNGQFLSSSWALSRPLARARRPDRCPVSTTLGLSDTSQLNMESHSPHMLLGGTSALAVTWFLGLVWPV